MPETVLKSNPTDPASQDANDEVSKLKAEVDKLAKAAEFHRQDADKAKRYVTALVAKMDEASNQPASSKTSNPEEEADRFLEAFKNNPQAALQSVMEDHWQRRMNPIMTEHLSTQAHQMKREAVRTIGEKKWEKYADEIDTFMEGMSLSTQAKPGAWEEAYRYVLAKHVDDEVEERVKSKLEKEVASSVEGSSTSGPIRYEKGAPLTALEQKIAREFNMSDEEWKKNKDSYEHWDKPRGRER